jgi:hypothetical protein
VFYGHKDVLLNTMAIDLHDRLRQSEEGRRRAWRVLEEIRVFLEILGDKRMEDNGSYH